MREFTEITRVFIIEKLEVTEVRWKAGVKEVYFYRSDIKTNSSPNKR